MMKSDGRLRRVRRGVERVRASRAELRKRLGAGAVDNFFRGMAKLGQLHPLSQPSRHGVQVQRDIPYIEGSTHPRHQLDLYLPAGEGPHPVVFYTHGGGFRILSKESHWVMGLMFASRGYAAVLPSYRLSGEAPFPAAVEDSLAALQWLITRGEEQGLDLERLVFAGESAGANLACVLTICCCYERPEPMARALFAQQIRPKVVMPACGMLQVSDARRFQRSRDLSNFIADRLHEVEDAYLQGVDHAPLADPLLVFESNQRPARTLPAFFAACGTGDILLEDSERLVRALGAMDVRAEMEVYEGELHAFHAFVIREQARQCWRDHFSFLQRHLPGAPGR